jgi:hypothetical protein
VHITGRPPPPPPHQTRVQNPPGCTWRHPRQPVRRPAPHRSSVHRLPQHRPHAHRRPPTRRPPQTAPRTVRAGQRLPGVADRYRLPVPGLVSEGVQGRPDRHPRGALAAVFPWTWV